MSNVSGKRALLSVLAAVAWSSLISLHAHAAGVAENVGDQVDAALRQDRVAVGVGGAVGAFGGEGADFVNVHLRVKAEAALEGAEPVVVLNAVAGEDLDLIVAHLHGEVDDDFVFALGEDFSGVDAEVHEIGGAIEVADDHLIKTGAWMGMIGSRRWREGRRRGKRR